jgi:hypothetical protein
MIKNPVKWLDDLAKDDYESAKTYLSLIYEEKTAATYVKKIRSAKISQYRAEDILRASELPVLDPNDKCVKKNRKKIATGKKLSPILLVRDPNREKVIIADGYHRICAVDFCNNATLIHCKII